MRDALLQPLEVVVRGIEDLIVRGNECLRSWAGALVAARVVVLVHDLLQV